MTFDDLNYMRFLETEIKTLKSRFEDHDTGHLRTAVSVLENRVKEVEKNIKEMIGNY